jgi:hypothetical protein
MSAQTTLLKDLILVARAKQSLAEATTIDEIKDIIDKAEALRLYMRKATDGLDIQNQAAEIGPIPPPPRRIAKVQTADLVGYINSLIVFGLVADATRPDSITHVMSLIANGPSLGPLADGLPISGLLLSDPSVV